MNGGGGLEAFFFFSNNVFELKLCVERPSNLERTVETTPQFVNGNYG